MRQRIALAWKEFREVRWVLGVALVIFIALPLIGGIEGRKMNHRIVFDAWPWVMFLGGVLATVVGATSVCRDLNGPLAEFWRSRAVNVGRWLRVKYCVGLAVIMVACLLPLVIEEWTERRDGESVHFAAVLAAWFPFVWAVQYSFGFVCGSLTRRAGPAIMLALALSLLGYFLPIILPPLRSLNIPEVLMYSLRTQSVGFRGPVPWVPWSVPFSPREQMPFAVTAIAVSAAAFALSLVAVRREWRIEAAQRLTYWSIGFAVLLLFASAAFQLEANLPVLQTIELGHPGEVQTIDSDGRHGILVTDARWTSTYYIPPAVQPMEIAADGVRLGPAVTRRQLRMARRIQAWLPEHPNICFVLSLVWPADNQAPRAELVIVTLPGAAATPITTRELGTSDLHLANPDLRLNAVGGRLLAQWQRDTDHMDAALIDVTDLAHPRVLPSRAFGGHDLTRDQSSRNVELPEIPGLQFRQRLAAAVDIEGLELAAIQGDVLATEYSPDPLLIYRFERVGATTTAATTRPPHDYAAFRQVGRYEPTLLEKMMNPWVHQVAGGNGYIYVSDQTEIFGTRFPRITVFDVSDPGRPRPIGHFAAPEEGPLSICPLPDGTLLVGGRRLYRLGPPPRR